MEKWFHGSPGYFQGIRVHIGERTRSVELRGAHEGGWRTALPRGLLDASLTPTPGLLDCVFSKKRSSRRFHSIWILFDIPFLRNTEIGTKQQFSLGLRLIG